MNPTVGVMQGVLEKMGAMDGFVLLPKAHTFICSSSPHLRVVLKVVRSSGRRETVLFKPLQGGERRNLRPSAEPLDFIDSHNMYFHVVAVLPEEEAVAEWKATGLVRVELWERVNPLGWPDSEEARLFSTVKRLQARK